MGPLDLSDGMEFALPLPAVCPARPTLPMAVQQWIGQEVIVCAAPSQPFENCRASTSIFVLPSYKEPTVDALAPRTDEGRE